MAVTLRTGICGLTGRFEPSEIRLSGSMRRRREPTVIRLKRHSLSRPPGGVHPAPISNLRRSR